MLKHVYISRHLKVNEGQPSERVLGEAEVVGLTPPLIVLGDPGVGKTKLTESLAERLGGFRMTAGSFVRTNAAARSYDGKHKLLIIDGLDEIAAANGSAAVDEVLKKLAALGAPPFLLSCRAADWQGSADRHKIESDYGMPVTTLRLLPFSRVEAEGFLTAVNSGINAAEVMRELDERNLGAMYGNPLTLRLVAELVADGEGLPESRSELFDQACTFLVREVNASHQRSEAALSNLNDLLDSAGAVCALLLISGSLGVSDQPRESTPAGFVLQASLQGLPHAPLVDAVLRTRLFQSAGEKLCIPVHRVIAEFLGARWVSKCLSGDLSARRILGCLTVSGGVPTQLRGLHAWLAHYNQGVAAQCIQTDPYGILRYGETAMLSCQQASLLLRALQTVANEDPYFRSEDWGAGAVAGLARSELKSEIVTIITQPDRHFHLSMLLLDALQGSRLTDEIQSELIALIKDRDAAYAERMGAAEALYNRQLEVDWTALTRKVLAAGGPESHRVAIDLMVLTKGAGLPPDEVADAVLEHLEPSKDDQRDRYVSGVYRKLAPALSVMTCELLLDSIVTRIERTEKKRHWRAGLELTSLLYALLARVVLESASIDVGKMWRWLKALGDERDYSERYRKKVGDFLNRNPELRRKLLTIAVNDTTIEGSPWMTVIHVLPSISDALYPTVSDVVHFLVDLAGRSELNDRDVDLWISLVRSKYLTDGFTDEVQNAVRIGTDRHSSLATAWRDITSPAVPDWKKQQEKRDRKYQQRRARKFELHRSTYLPHVEDIRDGKSMGILIKMAHAYMGRFNDLHHEKPGGRLEEWMGGELAAAALSGFKAALGRDDLPSSQAIAESHAQHREYHVEAVIKCGIAELLLAGDSVASVRQDVLLAGLVSWSHIGEPSSEQLGLDLGKELEKAVLISRDDKIAFLRTLIEPQLNAGRESVSYLYSLRHDDIYHEVAGELALQWLRRYPTASARVQADLVDITLRLAPGGTLRELVHERLSLPLHPDLRKVWMSAAFATELDYYRNELVELCRSDQSFFWSLRDVIRPERRDHWAGASIHHFCFIVETCAQTWPPCPHPSSGWSGDTNPWDASEFVGLCIGGISAEPSAEAAAVLDHLLSLPQSAAYAEQIKHAKAQQRRRRWDSEFVVPTFEQARSVFTGGVPTQVDDLKAMTLDIIALTQDYVRNGDTNGWEAFWNGDSPKDENTSRDRFLDLARRHFPQEIVVLSEVRMPENRRVDINVIHRDVGIPIEIKGQWHRDVWNASSVQLDANYTRDWRADGRGIYVVLWFGSIAGRALPPHPDGLEAPSSADELECMLTDRLSESQRSRIKVVVINLMRPNTS